MLSAILACMTHCLVGLCEFRSLPQLGGPPLRNFLHTFRRLPPGHGREGLDASLEFLVRALVHGPVGLLPLARVSAAGFVRRQVCHANKAIVRDLCLSDSDPRS